MIYFPNESIFRFYHIPGCFLHWYFIFVFIQQNYRLIGSVFIYFFAQVFAQVFLLWYYLKISLELDYLLVAWDLYGRLIEQNK